MVSKSLIFLFLGGALAANPFCPPRATRTITVTATAETPAAPTSPALSVGISAGISVGISAGLTAVASAKPSSDLPSVEPTSVPSSSVQEPVVSVSSTGNSAAIPAPSSTASTLSTATRSATSSAPEPTTPGSTTPPGTLPPTFKTGAKWQFEIQDPVLIPSAGQPLVPDADIWVIDLWHAQKNRSTVDALHARGKTVICYFNFGAVQPPDCDFDKWITKSLWSGPWYGDVNGDTYCEKYVDLKNADVLSLLTGRLDAAAAAGCDGVDPDNIDIYGAGVGVSEAEAVKVLKSMAEHAHGLTTALGNRLMIGQKNAPEVVGQLVGAFDFAVLESCIGESMCDDFAAYPAAGKPVVNIEYPTSLGGSGRQSCNAGGISASDRAKVCKSGAGNVPAGFSQVLKLDKDEAGLNGCTQYCDSDVVITDTIEADERNSCDFATKMFNSAKTCTSELKKNACCDGR